MSLKPSETKPRSFKQSCSPHIALQHCGIGLTFSCSVWEMEMEEDCSFSWLETEFGFQSFANPSLELRIS
jgi:hypothetical protein